VGTFDGRVLAPPIGGGKLPKERGSEVWIDDTKTKGLLFSQCSIRAWSSSLRRAKEVEFTVPLYGCKGVFGTFMI
jgi:hypothetical protein